MAVTTHAVLQDDPLNHAAYVEYKPPCVAESVSPSGTFNWNWVVQFIDAYIALGVHEVWLVDRWNKVIEVSRAGGWQDIVRDMLHWRRPTPPSEAQIALTEVFAGL